jgi:hypothetical protein
VGFRLQDHTHRCPIKVGEKAFADVARHITAATTELEIFMVSVCMVFFRQEPCYSNQKREGGGEIRQAANKAAVDVVDLQHADARRGSLFRLDGVYSTPSR